MATEQVCTAQQIEAWGLANGWIDGEGFFCDPDPSVAYALVRDFAGAMEHLDEFLGWAIDHGMLSKDEILLLGDEQGSRLNRPAKSH